MFLKHFTWGLFWKEKHSKRMFKFYLLFLFSILKIIHIGSHLAQNILPLTLVNWDKFLIIYKVLLCGIIFSEYSHLILQSMISCFVTIKFVFLQFWTFMPINDKYILSQFSIFSWLIIVSIIIFLHAKMSKYFLKTDAYIFSFSIHTADMIIHLKYISLN